MPTVVGQGTTFNLPNYHGQLFNVTPTETPFLTAIGGLNRANQTTSTVFEWQTMSRRPSTPNNVAVEGATAPDASEESRTNVTNVVEIHHRAIEVSYTKQAARGNFNGANIAPEPDDATLDELAVQTQAELESIAVDIEQSFLYGTFANPTDATAPRKTQGIVGIAGTTQTGGALTPDMINSLLQAMFTAGAKLPAQSTVFLVSPDVKVAITAAYAKPPVGLVTQSRNVGGLSIDTVITPFGQFGVAVDRWLATGTLLVANLSVCKPVFLNIPNKGLLFVEPLAKTGSSDKYQLYGEVGLEYGPPTEHGVLTGITAPAEAA